MVGERASPETIEKIRKEIGADKGIVQRYLGYVSLLLTGEMGRSYYTNRKVLDEIAAKLPNTLRLAAGAMCIAVPFGILLGLVSAIKKNSISDKLITIISITGLSVPVFWSGLVLMLLFSLHLKVLPPSGTGDMRYLLLPAVDFVITGPGFNRQGNKNLRSGSDGYAICQNSKGKRHHRIRIHIVHILKNAMVPVVTVTGLEFGSYLNGAVLTETIFGWDGIGRFIMEGIMKRDYPVIMGCIISRHPDFCPYQSSCRCHVLLY